MPNLLRMDQWSLFCRYYVDQSKFSELFFFGPKIIGILKFECCLLHLLFFEENKYQNIYYYNMFNFLSIYPYSFIYSVIGICLSPSSSK